MRPFALVLLLAACSGGRAEQRPASPAPKWVKSPPESSKAKIYAVGMSGPTYYREDAIQYAKDDARAQLAATISTHVQQLMVDVQEANGAYHDSADVISADEQYTDTVVQNAQILETWVDEDGAFSDGRKGTTYALGLLDWNAVQAPKAAAAAAKPPPAAEVKQVQDEAKAAFDQMDAEHQKKKEAAAPQPAPPAPK